MTKANKVNILLILLFLFQIADGVLTHLGVSRFGIGSEGNPLLKFLISTLGLDVALSVVKGVALAVVCSLFLLSGKIKNDIRYILLFVDVCYLICILGWVYLLFLSDYI